MEEKDSKPTEKIEFYTISIKGGDKERNIRLSSGMFRFAIASVLIGGLLLIGTGAYSFYSTMKMQRDALTIQEIEQAAELRQEQLLTLSKKAANLSETIQNLAQQEQELRIQAGLNPPKEDKPPESAPVENAAAPAEVPLTPDEKIHAVINSAKGVTPAPQVPLTPDEKIHAIINSAKANTPPVENIAPAPQVQTTPQISVHSEEEIRGIINSVKTNTPPVESVAPAPQVQTTPQISVQSEEEIRGIINSAKTNTPSVENVAPAPQVQTTPQISVHSEEEIRGIIDSVKTNTPTVESVTPAPQVRTTPQISVKSEEEIRGIINSVKTNTPSVESVAPAPQVQTTPQISVKSEEEIRGIIDSVKEDKASDNYNGQGGPVGELDIAEVSEALDMLEAKVSTRKESLDGFQTELKQQREQLAVGAAIASGYSPNFESYTAPIPNGSVQFDFANGLPIIPAAGAIPAPGSFPFDPSLVGGSGAADSHIPSIWPTTGVVSSPYGLRWGGTDFHPGMDIANDMGTPIVATADGIVEYAGWNSGGYGNMVDIDHGNGIMTRYGHAMQVVVSTGQHVKRGQLIAYMGSTGFSTGPHVHYEVHVNGNRVNPISYL